MGRILQGQEGGFFSSSFGESPHEKQELMGLNPTK